MPKPSGAWLIVAVLDAGHMGASLPEIEYSLDLLGRRKNSPQTEGQIALHWCEPSHAHHHRPAAAHQLNQPLFCCNTSTQVFTIASPFSRLSLSCLRLLYQPVQIASRESPPLNTG